MKLSLALWVATSAVTAEPSFFQTLDRLPPELARVEARIAATARSFIAVTPRRGTTRLWESKYRGDPYLPKTMKYPEDAKGRPMPLLAQLNLAEISKSSGAPNTGLPESGILQFFISDRLEDPMYWGLRHSNPFDAAEDLRLNTTQEYFAVRHHPEVLEDESALVTNFSFLPAFEMIPVMGAYRLAFAGAREFVARTDFAFERLLGDRFFDRFGERAFIIAEFYDQRVQAAGNKVGGYASFAQGDPRPLLPNPDDWVLLLQIDSAEGADILWGDGGVGHFFIERAALKRREFSRVLYHWDNH